MARIHWTTAKSTTVLKIAPIAVVVVFQLGVIVEGAWGFQTGPSVQRHDRAPEANNPFTTKGYRYGTSSVGHDFERPCESCHVPSRLRSTPFEADFYNPDRNPYEDRISLNSLRQSPDTPLVLGLNKYSHDTTLCAANAATGEVLFAVSKERLSRRKHDSGNVAVLVDACLEALDLDLENIKSVVMNNHHHRILPLMERNVRHMEWECGLNINGGMEEGYDDQENLLPNSERHELSHHLAHAYSAAAQAPFATGLIVVMDGMGETYRTMMLAQESNDPTYTSDFTIHDPSSMTLIPPDLHERARVSFFDWREAESVYTFTKKDSASIDMKPIFKRFTCENSPPVLYNHGFENMDSVGALYSRASSHIFGDWNACGKVMGLAPWMVHSWEERQGGGRIIVPVELPNPIVSGSLYKQGESGLKIDRTYLEGMPLIARSDPDLFRSDGTQKKRYDFDDNESEDDDNDDDGAYSQEDEQLDSNDDATSDKKRLPTQVALEAIALAHRMQVDLETVVIEFVRHFQQQTGEKNLCLAGGVALNSVLNGRLARELGFDRTFIPPYPGDDGIAIGCCAFGLFGNHKRQLTKEQRNNNNASEGGYKTRPPLVWSGPLSPYLGPDYSEADIQMAIDDAAPWLEFETIRNVDRRLQRMAEEVESGAVVAWFQSRSEMGPRALGHRSIVADPRKKGLVRFINESVKKRESFRPFAPSVLAEEASGWFDLGDKVPDDGNVSPYMSMTAFVKQAKRQRIPAVTHVDGSSRLQTVTKDAEPLYHKFIIKFFAMTGVPMVLNTSFNTLPGEPIVESPADAIRSFLCSMGSIEMLVMDDFVIKRKEPNLRKLLGEAYKDGDIKSEQVCPERAGPATFQSTFHLDSSPIMSDEGDDDGDDDDGDNDNKSIPRTTTRVRMPDRPMHQDGGSYEWVELLDELEADLLTVCDGTVTMNDIMAQYTETPDGKKLGKHDVEEAQNLLQNIVHRFVRLYEQTLIHW